jgi:urease accessory protein
MWCERIIRNCGDPSGPCWSDQWAGRSVDWVDIQWTDCGRVLKKQTRSGQPVRVLLPPGQTLRHGDVIYEDAQQAIAIHVLPCEVIVARPDNARTLALLALELGNLHMPAQIDRDEIAFIEDGPAMGVVDALQVRWTREVRRFEPVQTISAPSVNVSPGLRMIIRSQENSANQEPAGPLPRSSPSSA